jgi:16S rRNA (uracil1498-N3)-methyltransferase
VDAIHGGAAELRGEDALHLTRVLRAAPGQVFEISDNRAAYLAEIAEARGERVVFRVLEPVETAPLPARIVLCVALIKFDRLEWIVEKATELGAERIQPIEAARSEKGLREASRKRAERWRRIARESSQQSRRLFVPEISPAAGFQECLPLAVDHRYFLEESIAPPLSRSLPSAKAASDRIALLTGPEGGWTDPEREAAAAAGWQPVSLGPQILRTETAVLAALAVIGAAWSG